MVRRSLEEGHTVLGIDRVALAAVDAPHYSALEVDMADYDAVERALRGYDALIHLAAFPGPTGRPPHVVHNNNVVASYNALAAAVAVGITRVCQASSINAIGGVYSREPRYDYFPVDELHPTHNEDPYSLSKWICEIQGDSIARRNEEMTIGSLRFHMVVDGLEDLRAHVTSEDGVHSRHLWGYTDATAAADACLRVLTADWTGHEAFYIVAPISTASTPSAELARAHYPDVPVHGELRGNLGFFDCAKAERLLGWVHPGGD